jgi:hypothetical protein
MEDIVECTMRENKERGEQGMKRREEEVLVNLHRLHWEGGKAIVVFEDDGTLTKVLTLEWTFLVRGEGGRGVCFCYCFSMSPK